MLLSPHHHCNLLSFLGVLLRSGRDLFHKEMVKASQLCLLVQCAFRWRRAGTTWLHLKQGRKKQWKMFLHGATSKGKESLEEGVSWLGRWGRWAVVFTTKQEIEKRGKVRDKDRRRERSITEAAKEELVEGSQQRKVNICHTKACQMPTQPRSYTQHQSIDLWERKQQACQMNLAVLNPKNSGRGTARTTGYACNVVGHSPQHSSSPWTSLMPLTRSWLWWPAPMK